MEWSKSNKDKEDDEDNDRFPFKNNTSNNRNPHSRTRTPIPALGTDSPSAATQATNDTSQASCSQPSPTQRTRQLDASRLSEIAARDPPQASEPTSTSDGPQPALIAYSTQLPHIRVFIIVTSSTSVLSLAFLIYALLPGPALVALSVWLASTAATLSILRRAALLWWNELRRRGLGQYLPDSTLRLLMHESIHSFMTDDTFMLENRHMLLYLLPIPPPQLERYVQRLAPRHRQRLQRRGLGHLLGGNFMRLLLGEDQWNDVQRRNRQPPIGNGNAGPPLLRLEDDRDSTVVETHHPTLEVVVESTPGSRLDQDSDNATDDESDLGIDLSADDLAGGLPDRQARNMAAALRLGDTEPSPATAEAGLPRLPPRQLFVSHRPLDYSNETMVAGSRDADAAPAVDMPPSTETASMDDDHAISLAEEYAEEELVLTQAVINAVYDGIWTPLSRYWMAAAEETAGPVTARLVTYGLGVSAVSTVLGLLLGMVGYRRGIYRRPTLIQAYPRENTLYTTVMLGLAGTGVTLLAHWHLRRGKGGRTQFYSQFRRTPRR